MEFIMTTLTIFAILLAPLFAIQASVIIDNKRQIKNRRLSTFRILMATRANRISNDHVNALNTIDLEFHGSDKNSKMVMEAWKQYKNNLYDPILLKNSPDSWYTRGDDLFIELLIAMSNCLNYDYDKSSLQVASYFPEAHEQIEKDWQIIRKGLSEILSGKSSIPISLASSESDEKQKELREMLENYLKFKNPIKVMIVKDNETL